MTRRPLRMFLAVFLTVFLGGLGVSGASALWSQQATVSTTVTTGTWVDYTEPGFSLPVQLTATHWPEGDSLLLYRGVALAWTPEVALDPSLQVTYRAETEGISRGLLGTIVNGVLEGDQVFEGPETTRNIHVTRPALTTEQWRVTITPIVNGVEGSPTVATLTMDRAGTVTMP